MLPWRSCHDIIKHPKQGCIKFPGCIGSFFQGSQRSDFEDVRGRVIAFSVNVPRLIGMLEAAFKEWAIIVESLGRGDQILIMRKGGLDEGPRGFEIQHARFWLFPTAYHQQRDQVTSEAAARWTEESGENNQDQTVLVRYGCEIVRHFELTRPEQITALRGHHVWSDKTLLQRMTWGNRDCLHALVVRTFEARKPCEIPMHGDYGGCKSWIHLHTVPDEQNARPVLNTDGFEQKLLSLMQAIS